MRKDLKLIGAAAERKAILRKLRFEFDEWKKIGFDSGGSEALTIVIEWVLKRCQRYNARKGGLGRKRKGV